MKQIERIVRLETGLEIWFVKDDHQIFILNVKSHFFYLQKLAWDEDPLNFALVLISFKGERDRNIRKLI